MSDFVITYDLRTGRPPPYRDVALAAEKEGLLYVWQGSSYVNRLPNTTLWGVFNDVNAAKAAFDRAIAAASKVVKYTIEVEKRLTLKSSSLSTRSDKKKVPEKKWTGKTEFETSRLHQVNDPFFAY